MPRIGLCLPYAQGNTKHAAMTAYSLRTREPTTTLFHNKSHIDAGHKISATFCSDYSCAAITRKDYFAKNNLAKGSANLTVSAKHDYERKKHCPADVEGSAPFPDQRMHDVQIKIEKQAH